MRIDSDQKVTLFILAALGAVFVLALWLPRQAQINELNERIEKHQRQVGYDRRDAAGLTDLAGNVRDLKLAVDTSKNYVPDRSELANLLRQLSAEMVRQELTDRVVQTEAVELGADYNVIPLRLTFRGSYDGAFRFIQYAESMRRLIRINRLAITGRPTRPNEPVSVEIELCTFSAPMEVPAP